MRNALALMLLLSLSCDRVWNAANQRQLNDDVRQLTKRDIDCSMIGTTRNAVCRGTASARDAAALAKSLGLHPIGHGDPEVAQLRALAEWPRGATILYPAFLTGLRREATESGLDARKTAVLRRRHS